MTRLSVARFVLLALVVAGLTGGSAASAFAASAGSAATGKVTVRHWIGTWRGKLSQHPPALPGDPRNPYKVVVTIRSVTKHTIGTVRYPAWKCSYRLVKRSATPGELHFLMKVVHTGPFNCVGQESVVLRKKVKGASFKGTYAGGTETGSVSKPS